MNTHLLHRLRRLRRMPLVSPRLWARRLAFWLGAVLVGLMAIGFAALADRAQDLFAAILGRSRWLIVPLAPAGLCLAVALTRSVFPGAQGSGIPQVIAALHMRDPARISRVLSLRVAAGKVLLTLVGLACGASIGREGPTVQVAASIMQALGRALRLPRLEGQRALVLAGGAAGVAAAFNTPLAGIVFAIEELSHSFEARTSNIVLTAVVVAGIATLALMGNYTYFGVSAAHLDWGRGWLAVAACAVAGGLAGGGFSRVLLGVGRGGGRGLLGRIGDFARRRPMRFAIGCGLAIAAIGLASGGTTYGTGYAQARTLVEGGARLPAAYFALKWLATTISYLSGIPGGIFAPSLAVGASLGSWMARLLPGITTGVAGGAPAGAIVLLGMVGYFSGVVQAPITAFVIVMEMTADTQMVVPLMATAMGAFGVSRLVCRRPLYGTLAARFLEKEGGEKEGGAGH